MGAIFYDVVMENYGDREDGRHARLERNKMEVVRALLSLIRENGEVPTAEVIARRAHVSRRSVFRFFDDRESLLRATVEYMYREVMKRFPVPDLAVLPIRDRIIKLVEHLEAIYEYITPVRRVSENLKTNNELIQREQSLVQAMYRRQIEAEFLDALPMEGSDREIVLDSLQLIASWNAWAFLRYDCKLSTMRTKRVMAHGMEAVLSRTA